MAFNFKNVKEGESVTGYYVGYFRNVGVFRKPVFAFREKDGKHMFHLWGSVVLNMAMYGIQFRSLVKITSTGKQKADKSKFLLNGYDVIVLESPETRTEREKKEGVLHRYSKRKKTSPRGKKVAITTN
jgi:hypothetical protein